MRLARASGRDNMHGEGRFNGIADTSDTRDDSGSLRGAPVAKVACHGYHELQM